MNKTNKNLFRFAGIGLCALALLVGAGVASGTRPDKTSQSTTASQTVSLERRVVLDWYRLSLELVRHTATYSPPVASRTFGYLGVAFYASVANRSGKLRSLAGQLNGLTHLPQPELNAVYDDAVVLHSALSGMVRALFANTGPSGQRALEAMSARLEREMTSRTIQKDVLERSRTYGQAVADAILAWASTDGGAVVDNLGFPLEYPKALEAAQWVPTSTIPLQQTPLLPRWGFNRPFALEKGDACPLPAPPAYSSQVGSKFHTEALEVYRSAQNLTPEQRRIARFWSDDPMLSFTPPGHWIAILTQLFEDQPTSLERMAEGYARLGIGLADAFIGCWHTKYTYNLLRPVTYIKRHIDPNWDALLTTPPFPEYPSGHSTLSGAAAVILSAMFGESFAFEDRTKLDDGMSVRSYPSFWAAAQEAGISRLYGGIHYRTAIVQGLEQGRCIGATVMKLRFQR
jgi:hypothetical protein